MSRDNMKLAALSLVMALCVWWWVSGRERVDVWLELPVQQIGRPEGLVVREGVKGRIEVRVRGSRGQLRGLDGKDLAYSLDLSGVRPGLNVAPVEPERIPLPKSVKVMETQPQRFNLVVDRLARKQVAVEPVYNATLPPGMALVRSETEPKTVEIEGPWELVKTIDRIKTQPIQASSPPPPLLREPRAALVPPDEIKVEPGRVAATLHFGLETERRDITLKIEIDNLSGKEVKFRPAQVKVKVEAPKGLLDDKRVLSQFRLLLQIPDNTEPGAYFLNPKPAHPPEASILEVEPETVAVTVVDIKRK